MDVETSGLPGRILEMTSDRADQRRGYHTALLTSNVYGYYVVCKVSESLRKKQEMWFAGSPSIIIIICTSQPSPDLARAAHRKYSAELHPQPSLPLSLRIHSPDFLSQRSVGHCHQRHPAMTPTFEYDEVIHPSTAGWLAGWV